MYLIMSYILLSVAAASYKEAHEAELEAKVSKREASKEGEQGNGGGSNSCYKELNQRLQRCKQLRQVALKMKTQKDLMVNS